MTLLFIDATVRGHEVSRTYRLARAFLDEYKKHNPDTEIVSVELEKLSILPHTRESLVERDILLATGSFDAPIFDEARRFAAADRIVIAAPFWDLSFPARLKVYIENISVGGLTFGFDGNRMFGKCRCEKLAYITTRGGTFETQDQWMECALPQMRAFAEMFGLGELSVVSAESLDIEGVDAEGILREAENYAREKAASF